MIYKTRWFDRWARKQGIGTPALCAAVAEMARGLADAELGSGLFKKRVARSGKGKSGGFRTLVATNKSDRWFFLFGFSKSDRSNIDPNEEEALKKMAMHLIHLPLAEMRKAEEAGQLIEVICDEQDEVSDSRGDA